MRVPFAVLPLLATLTPFTLADVEFTSPAAGASLPAGALTVQWTDSGSAPSISQLDQYTLELVLGGNEAGADTIVFPIDTGSFGGSNSATGRLTPTQAGSTRNGFYLRMTSTATDGGTIINYSDRFTVTGLTGITPPNVVQAVPGGTTGPPTENNVVPAGAQADAPAVVVPAEGDYDIPYDKQGGTIKYAPMQPFPPTKMSKNGKPTPLFGTSAFTIATARMPPPTVISTITESQTKKAMTMENTVAPQAHPSDDMAKFLARWKD